MALREVAIPQHISILYVQQEVIGDDTPAIESVLQADVHRSHLLAEEAQLNETISSLEKEAETVAAQGAATSASASEEDAAKHHAELRKVERKKDDAISRLGEVQKLLIEIDADSGPSRAAELLAGLGFSRQDQVRLLPDAMSLFRKLTKAPARSRFTGHAYSCVLWWMAYASLARPCPVLQAGSLATRRAVSPAQPVVSRLQLTPVDRARRSNNLDLNALAWLEDYLQTWPSTLLVVSHDRSFLNAVATDIIHQHNERLDYYKGNFAQFYATKSDRQKQQKREYEAQLQYRQHLQAFIDKWRCELLSSVIMYVDTN